MTAYVLYGTAYSGDQVCQFFTEQDNINDFTSALPGVYKLALIKGVDYEALEMSTIATIKQPSDSITYYSWRERMPTGQLVVPCADPMVYEYAYDFMFDTIEHAEDFVDGDDNYDPDTWVLVQITEREIP